MPKFTRRRSNHGLDVAATGSAGVIEWDCFDPSFNTADDVNNDSERPVSINDPWPDSPSTIKCRQYSIRRVGRSKMFLLSARWEVPTSGAFSEEENPLVKPTEYQWTNIVLSEPIDRDYQGNPIVLSSTRGIDGGTPREFNAKRLAISQNVAPPFAISTSLAFENTINSDPWKGGEPGEVRCLQIIPVNVYTATAAYITLQHEFEFRAIEIWGDDPHQPRILDKDEFAFATIDGSDQLVRICTKKGQPVEVLLNGKGAPLTTSNITYLDENDQPVADPTWATPGVPPLGAVLEYAPSNKAVYLRYKTYPPKAFAPLGL